LRETGIEAQAIFLEPVGRNTAPAVAIAALHLAQLDPEALLLVLPSDHFIADIPAFHQAVELAAESARKGYLVTFGIQPSAPETGFGYIQRGESLSSNSHSYKVARFVEKPNLETAERYVESGDYYWNSGMFLFSAARFIDELEKYAPSVLEASRAALEYCYEDLDFYRIGEEQFSTVPSISIDYAVMEKTDKAAVVPSNIGWSDVGSWSALWEHGEKDKCGNVSRGEVILHETKNSYILAQHRLVATTGVQDIVVVETPDAVLVAHKDASQDVKSIVDKLKEHGRTEHETHRKVYRPWGSYEGMDRGERFQVKRIIVNPGAKLSLQMHHHRAEHWIVVSGIAEVTVDENVSLIHENQSIYIPLGSMHRLHNPGRIPLHLIEVQSGSYLGEDDIVRTEDIYGRSS
jgi:mannose-1-phosphate guanylyltransferase/mannose-6-phosphate isomerase